MKRHAPGAEAATLCAWAQGGANRTFVIRRRLRRDTLSFLLVTPVRDRASGVTSTPSRAAAPVLREAPPA